MAVGPGVMRHLLLIAVLAYFLLRGYPARPAGRSGQRTLLVTGVPRPDAGQQYVTTPGSSLGPRSMSTPYRMAVDVDQWPTAGQILPVVFSPKNFRPLDVYAQRAAWSVLGAGLPCRGWWVTVSRTSVRGRTPEARPAATAPW